MLNFRHMLSLSAVQLLAPPPLPHFCVCLAACSRKVQELKKAGRMDVTLHCMANGNYEPLQCDLDVCFCVNSTTAQPYGATVARDMWKGLSCCEYKLIPRPPSALTVKKNLVTYHYVRWYGNTHIIQSSGHLQCF